MHPRKPTDHKFLDEAGDTTFFGKGRVSVLGTQGVSLAFGIGMVEFREPLEPIRGRIRALARAVEGDSFLNCIPSVAKKIAKGGFHFHATDDPPEVRERFFKLIHSLNCSLEMIVARKDAERFVRKHGGKEAEFYADVLSHLIKGKLRADRKLVLNISERGNTTKNTTLQRALEKGIERFLKTRGEDAVASDVVFNVQRPTVDPLLCVADYLCWSVQRVFERGEVRYYSYLREKVTLVADLYDRAKHEGNRNFYGVDNPLTAANKIGPPSP